MSHEILEPRDKRADALLSVATDKSARARVAEEIFHSLLEYPTLQTQEFKALLIKWRHVIEDFEAEYQKYQEGGRWFYPSGYESIVRDAQHAMAEYCSRQDIFEKYVKNFRKGKIDLGEKGQELASQLMQPKIASVVKTTARTVSPSPLSDWKTWVIIASSVNAAAAQPFVNKVFGSNAENVTGGAGVGDALPRAPKVFTVPPKTEEETQETQKTKAAIPEKPSLHETFLTLRNDLMSLLPGKVAGIADNPQSKIKAEPPAIISALLTIISNTRGIKGIDWESVHQYLESRRDVDIPEMLVREGGQNQRPQASYLLGILALDKKNYQQALMFFSQAILQADGKYHPIQGGNIDYFQELFTAAIHSVDELESRMAHNADSLTRQEYRDIKKAVTAILSLEAFKDKFHREYFYVERWNDAVKRARIVEQKCKEKLNKQAEAQARKETKTEAQKSPEPKNSASVTSESISRDLIDFREKLILLNKGSSAGFAEKIVSTSDPNAEGPAAKQAAEVIMSRDENRVKEYERKNPGFMKALEKEALENDLASGLLAALRMFKIEDQGQAVILFAQAFLQSPVLLSHEAYGVTMRFSFFNAMITRMRHLSSVALDQKQSAFAEIMLLKDFAVNFRRYIEKMGDRDKVPQLKELLKVADQVFASVDLLKEQTQKLAEPAEEIVARWEGIDDIEIVGEGNKIFLRKPSAVPEKSKKSHAPVTTDDALKDALFELITFYKTQPISHKGFVSHKEGLFQEGTMLPEVMEMGMEVAANYGPSEQEAVVGYNAYLKKNPKVQDKIFQEASKGSGYASYLLASIQSQGQAEAVVFSAQCVRKPDKKDKNPYSAIELFLKVAQKRLHTLKDNASAREEVTQIERAMRAVQEYFDHVKSGKKEKTERKKAEAQNTDPLSAIRKHFQSHVKKLDIHGLEEAGITLSPTTEGVRYPRELSLGLKGTQVNPESMRAMFARARAKTDPFWAIELADQYTKGDVFPGMGPRKDVAEVLLLQARLLAKPSEVDMVEKAFKKFKVVIPSKESHENAPVHPAKQKTSQVQRDLDWVLSMQAKKGLEKQYAEELGVNLELTSLQALPPDDVQKLMAALEMHSPAKDIVTVRNHALQGIQLALQYMSRAAAAENKFGNAAAFALQLVKLNPTGENYVYLVNAIAPILEREYTKTREMTENWNAFDPDQYHLKLKWFEIMQRAHQQAPSRFIELIDRWKQLPSREALAKMGIQIPVSPATPETMAEFDKAVKEFDQWDLATKTKFHQKWAAKGVVASALGMIDGYRKGTGGLEWNLPLARLFARIALRQNPSEQHKNLIEAKLLLIESRSVESPVNWYLAKWMGIEERSLPRGITAGFISILVIMSWVLFRYLFFWRNENVPQQDLPRQLEMEAVEKIEKTKALKKTPEKKKYKENLKKLGEIKQKLFTMENRKAEVDVKTFALWAPWIQHCHGLVDQEYPFEKANELEEVLTLLLPQFAACEEMIAKYVQAENEEQERKTKAAKEAKREAKVKRAEEAKQAEVTKKIEDAKKAYEINQYKLDHVLNKSYKKIMRTKDSVEKKLGSVEKQITKLNAELAELDNTEMNWKTKERLSKILLEKIDACNVFKAACCHMIELCETFTRKYSDVIAVPNALEDAVLLEGCVQELETLQVGFDHNYPVLLRTLKTHHEEMENKLGVVRAEPNNNNNNNNNNAHPDEDPIDEPALDRSSTSSEKAEETTKAVSPKTSSLLSQSAEKFYLAVSQEPLVRKPLASEYQGSRLRNNKNRQKPKREEGAPVMRDGFVEFNLSNRVDCLKPLVNKPTLFDEHLFLERLAMHCHLLRLHRFLLAAYREREKYPVRAPFCEESYGQFLDDMCNMLMHNYFVVEKFGHAKLLKFVQTCYVNQEMDAKTPLLVSKKPFYNAMRVTAEGWVNIPRTISELISDFQLMCGYLARLYAIGEKMGMATKLYDPDYLAACQMTLSIVGEVCARIYALCPKFKEIAKENPDKSLLSLVNFLHRCRKYMRNVTKHEEDVSAAFDAWRHKFTFFVEDVFQTDIQAILKAGVELNRPYNKERFQELQETLEKMMTPSLSRKF